MSSLFAKINASQISASARSLRTHLHTPLFMNAYLLILNQGLSAGLGFLYWMAAARYYPTGLVGQASALISTLGFLSVLAEFSLKSGMQRFLPRAGRHVQRMVLITYAVVLLLTGILTVLFFTIGHLLRFADSLLLGLSPTSLLLLILANMVYTIFVVQDGVLMGIRRTQWVLVENTIYNISKMVLLLVGISGLFENGIVASWFIPVPLVVLLVNGLIFWRFIPRFFKAASISGESVHSRQVIKSVAGDHLGTVLSETSIRLLPLLVINLLGASASAYFYQAWMISTMLYLLSWNVSASFAVEAASHPEKIVQYSRQTLRQILSLLIPLTLIAAAGAPLILGIFGSVYAREGTTLLRLLALSAIPYGFNAWYLSYSRVRMHIRSVILLQGLQCVITLGMSFWGLPRYGIGAIGLAWFVAQAAISIFAILQSRSILFGAPAGKASRQLAEVSPRSDRDRAAQAGSPLQGLGPGALALAEEAPSLYLFLSPHLDDAVLSCGGLLSRLARAGKKVLVVSVFTADLSKGLPLSWLARRNLRSWGLEAAGKPFSLRCQEDIAAAQFLGVKTAHLGFLDALYRRSQGGALYYPRSTVGLPLHPEDQVVTGQAVSARLKELRAEVTDPASLQVFVPLGLGGHVDHQLVRACAESVFDREILMYYEDMPYAARRAAQVGYGAGVRWNNPAPWLQQASEPRAVARVALTPDEIEARIEASACYRSQIPGLYPGQIRRNLEILSARAPWATQELWPLYRRFANPAGPRKKMERSLKTYIQQAGGENYWYHPHPESMKTRVESGVLYGQK
jgi:LmbE family N-acetylglucosaminyl deacetylase/O-antigen/teichoic acid export membrane protein